MKFRISDALRYGWNVFKQDATFLVIVGLIIVGISIVFVLLSMQFQSGLSQFIFTILQLAVSIVIQVGIVKISLNYTYNIESTYNDLFNHAQYALKFFLANLLYGLLVFAGTIMLIVPGIYWAIKYSQINYFIVDKDMDPIEAFKASGEVTKYARMDLFLFYLTIAGLAILSVFTLFLGLFILYPVLYIAQAYIYRELVRNTNSEEQIAERNDAESSETGDNEPEKNDI